MGVQIRSTPVDLKHKFVLVPLVYNKVTRDRDFLEMDLLRANGTNPVMGQSFPKFIDYNNLVLADVEKSYPNSYVELGDPNMLLAVLRTWACSWWVAERAFSPWQLMCRRSASC